MTPRSSSWSRGFVLAAPALAVTVAVGVAVDPRDARATAPCFDVCHLGQGQPLLLADAKALWVRRCTTPKPGASSCVLERVAIDGRVLEQVPLSASYDDDAFETAHLKGHTVVRLGYQSAWTDLTKPYTVEPYKARHSLLRIDRDALVCAAAGGGSSLRLPLGCAPRGVSVFAAGIGRDSKPEDPAGTAVVVATCADGAGGAGTREVVAICRPGR